MNQIREQMVAGIPASAVPGFRRRVANAVEHVERSCHLHGLSPDDLPAPSRRAYRYLKRIDLTDLPIRKDRSAKTIERIRISNVVSSCRSFHRELAILAGARNIPREAGVDLPARLRSLDERMAASASLIESLCNEMGSRPAMLPDPTRRAYQWLKFLGQEQNLAQHFRTLKQAYQADRDLRIEIYHIAGLYRSGVRKGVRRVVMSEAFVGAPRQIIRALVRAATSKQNGGLKAQIRRYSETEAFRETLLALELIGADTTGKARGTHYDLEEIFAGVNGRYLGAQLSRPTLRWSKLITHGKFGHYVPASDTLMINMALDSPHIPRYVIEQVMHHELLHKKLGVRIVNGRRMAHTPEFRIQERSFERYHEAQAFLREISMELR